MPPASRGNKRDQRVGNSPRSDDSGWGRWRMPWPTTVAQPKAVRWAVQRQMNGCSLFGCSARLNRRGQNRCHDSSIPRPARLV